MIEFLSLSLISFRDNNRNEENNIKRDNERNRDKINWNNEINRDNNRNNIEIEIIR